MKPMWLIAWNTIRDLWAKKVYLLLPFFILYTGLQVWPEFQNSFLHLHYALQSFNWRIRFIDGMTHWWFLLTVIVAIIFGSGLVSNEQKQKTILGMLSKPVSRRGFLLGKLAGLHLFFGAFVLLDIATNLGFMIFWNIPIQLFFLLSELNNLIVLAIFSALAFGLSVFTPRILGGGLTVILYWYGFYHYHAIKQAHTLGEFADKVLYYLVPAKFPATVKWDGVLSHALINKPCIAAAVLLTNAMQCTILVFCARYYCAVLSP